MKNFCKWFILFFIIDIIVVLVLAFLLATAFGKPLTTSNLVAIISGALIGTTITIVLRYLDRNRK